MSQEGARLVRLVGVSKTYESEGVPVTAVRDVTMEIRSGEFVAVTGPSGCGKSTLLHMMGAMDRPTQGEVWIGDTPVHRLSEDDLTAVRRLRVGFVFQFFHLLPTLTVEENVALPLLLAGSGETGNGRVRAVLESVGLRHRMDAKPTELSGGEMQRVAIARAVVHNPPLIVADEPTGNLDSGNGRGVLELLSRLSTEGTTVVMATHSEMAGSWAHREVRMNDGSLVS
jgi:putative ABC transport system ATP-binding protein